MHPTIIHRNYWRSNQSNKVMIKMSDGEEKERCMIVLSVILNQLGNWDAGSVVVFILFPNELLLLVLFSEHHEPEQQPCLLSKQPHELIYKHKMPQQLKEHVHTVECGCLFSNAHPNETIQLHQMLGNVCMLPKLSGLCHGCLDADWQSPLRTDSDSLPSLDNRHPIYLPNCNNPIKSD